MSRAWARGSTRAWRRLRAHVLDRDGQRCQVPDPITGQPCGRYANTAGHIIPRSHGGPDTLANLRAECLAHNLGDGPRLARLRVRPWAW